MSSTTRALICHDYNQPPTLSTLPLPSAHPGSAIVKILASLIEDDIKKTLYSPRNPHFSNPTPFIPGVHAVGRITALGPDATSLQEGQLVLIDPFTRGRDDADAKILRGLFGGPDPAAQKLSQEGNWRDGTWAQYVRVPMENVFALDEKKLLGKTEEGGLGYGIADLPHLDSQAVAYGSLRAIDLKPGETIIIAPATGSFSGAACEVASAMGATVVAVGRNKDTLQRLATHIPRVHPVSLSGDPEKDIPTLQKFGTIDVYMDFTPMTMQTPPYLKTGLAALRTGGRAVLTGFAYGELAAAYGQVVLKGLTIKGQYMYSREDVKDMIKLVEKGLLKLGKAAGIEVLGQYGLDEWERALEHSEETAGWGRQVVFVP